MISHKANFLKVIHDSGLMLLVEKHRDNMGTENYKDFLSSIDKVSGYLNIIDDQNRARLFNDKV